MANSPRFGISKGMIYIRGKAPIKSGRTAGIAISVILHASFAAAQSIPGINARLVAVNIPGASAIAQIGTFLNQQQPPSPPAPVQCSHPIPTGFPSSIQPGAVLDPKRLLVGSTSNFGAPVTAGAAAQGSFLSIDPSGPGTLGIPMNFAAKGTLKAPQASALGGAVQMFSANSPAWLNSVNNSGAKTAGFAGVSNPLGLSNNNGFGRLWPANAPLGLDGEGSSTILDPTGLPLKGAPNSLIGGVYAGDLTDRNVVTSPPQPQVIPGGLDTGAVGTALLGPSLDGTCKAVFAVVTADGAIVQEHTLKGLDGLAPAGTVNPITGGDSNTAVSPRFGTIMNPYTTQEQQGQGVIRQLFTSEPFSNTIAVLDLISFGTSSNNQVFGPGTLSRINSTALNRPVDLTPVQRDQDDVRWASNTTLDQGSDFYVANQGDNTIVRMRQDGTVFAIRKVMLDGQPLENVVLNGIAASVDATDTTPPSTIFATFVDPHSGHGGVLAMPGF